MINSTTLETRKFVARWINHLLIEYGFLGWVDENDLTPDKISGWLDREALDELHIALLAMLDDRDAKFGHELAKELLHAVRLDKIRTEERGYIKLKRRPMRRAEKTSQPIYA